MTTFEQLDKLTDLECRRIAYLFADRIGGEPVTPTDLLRWINQTMDERPVYVLGDVSWESDRYQSGDQSPPPRTCPECGGACTQPGDGPHGQIGGVCTICGWDYLTAQSGDPS